MSKICALCLGLVLVAGASPATASSHERSLPRASSLLTQKLVHNQGALGHGPARVNGDKWGRSRLTLAKPQRGQSMPHLSPR